VVDGGCLLNTWASRRPVGSNPAVSAHQSHVSLGGHRLAVLDLLSCVGWLASVAQRLRAAHS
jgi:prepilin signal peptidase PulO-like enzyme (type II secretory pathway)